MVYEPDDGEPVTDAWAKMRAFLGRHLTKA